MPFVHTVHHLSSKGVKKEHFVKELIVVLEAFFNN